MLIQKLNNLINKKNQLTNVTKSEHTGVNGGVQKVNTAWRRHFTFTSHGDVNHFNATH
jgi:hypothetical protein